MRSEAGGFSFSGTGESRCGPRSLPALLSGTARQAVCRPDGPDRSGLSGGGDGCRPQDLGAAGGLSFWSRLLPKLGNNLLPFWRCVRIEQKPLAYVFDISARKAFYLAARFVSRGFGLMALLAKAGKATTLTRAAACLKVDPVRNEDSEQQMVFCPKTGDIRVWRLVK